MTAGLPAEHAQFELMNAAPLLLRLSAPTTVAKPTQIMRSEIKGVAFNFEQFLLDY